MCIGLLPSHFALFQFPEGLRRQRLRGDERQSVLELSPNLFDQRREVGQLELCGSNSGGVEGQDLTAPVRLQFFVVDHDTGQMNDRRMERECAGILRTQLTA